MIELFPNIKTVKLSEDTFMYLQKAFDSFDKLELSLMFTESDNLDYYQIKYAYSFDKINYSEFVLYKDFDVQSNGLTVYIAIKLEKTKLTDIQKPLTLYQKQNVKSELRDIELLSVSYDSIDIDLFDESVIKFQTVYQLVNQFPKWNFYDNQQVTINRWLNQCNSMAEMYGHTCIYFRTEPIESKTEHIFANHVFRNVTAIKKLHIMFPGNELPQDRNTYTDWDMPLQDDFVCNVVTQKFEMAFGDNTIPNEKDYLFLPLLNKLFRVSTVQPKNGFMGKVGWWEVYLMKFEEDDCVTIKPDLKSVMTGLEDFDLAIDSIDTLDDTLKSEIFEELEDFELDTLRTNEKIQEDTVEEKKTATQNYTNKLVDSTHYVGLKETEKLREYYDARLALISVNADNSSFPITMYDNSTVGKRIVAMQYCLKDFTTKNKFQTLVNSKFQLSFNTVILKLFDGEMFDLLDETGTLSLFTVKINRSRKLEIINNQQNILVDYQINLTEIYNIIIGFDVVLKQISVKIISLKNRQKSLDYQNIYIVDGTINPFTLSYVHLFGGSFYSNEIQLSINDNMILKDYTNPLLVMKQF